MYSSTLSLTSALDGVGGQRRASAALPPGKTRYPLYRRLGGPQGWSGPVRKISPPPDFDPRTVQPVASLYTDWAIPAHKFIRYRYKTSSCKLDRRKILHRLRQCVHEGPCSKWNQRDAFQQVFYCTLVGSTCFGCRRHPSSGAQYVQSGSVGTMCVW